MTSSADDFSRLREICAASGPGAMFDALAARLAAQRRWHAVFDAKLMQARLDLGLPASGHAADIPPGIRDQLDERSLVACREVGWPLLAEGHVAAAWMYLRAAADPADVSEKLAALAAAHPDTDDPHDEDAARRLQEIVGLALWEGVDPALGISLVLRTQGTCNAITAYEQAVSRLPAVRQRPAAAVLVGHLHAEVAKAVMADLRGRGIAGIPSGSESIVALLESASGLADDPSIHVDVSHLQSVLRIARVCDDPATVRQAWELACYGSRLPQEVVYPGEPPFEDVAGASRLFFGAQFGSDVAEAVMFFRRAAATAAVEQAGTLPCDTLVLLLWRLRRVGEALQAALDRPPDDGMPSGMLAAGLLPSLIDLAAASGDWESLRRACIARGDEITYAASLAAERSAGSPQQA
jgi:hypothetical protein